MQIKIPTSTPEEDSMPEHEDTDTVTQQLENMSVDTHETQDTDRVTQELENMSVDTHETQDTDRVAQQLENMSIHTHETQYRGRAPQPTTNSLQLKRPTPPYDDDPIPFKVSIHGLNKTLHHIAECRTMTNMYYTLATEDLPKLKKSNKKEYRILMRIYDQIETIDRKFQNYTKQGSTDLPRAAYECKNDHERKKFRTYFTKCRKFYDSYTEIDSQNLDKIRLDINRFADKYETSMIMDKIPRASPPTSNRFKIKNITAYLREGLHTLMKVVLYKIRTQIFDLKQLNDEDITSAQRRAKPVLYSLEQLIEFGNKYREEEMAYYISAQKLTNIWEF